MGGGGWVGWEQGGRGVCGGGVACGGWGRGGGGGRWGVGRGLGGSRGWAACVVTAWIWSCDSSDIERTVKCGWGVGRAHVVDPGREQAEEEGATMATQLAPGLARKVKMGRGCRADTPETIACLKGLSECYGENTPAARRGARSHHSASNLHPVSSL